MNKDKHESRRIIGRKNRTFKQGRARMEKKHNISIIGKLILLADNKYLSTTKKVKIYHFTNT